MKNIWHLIAEAFGFETEGPMNFSKLGQKRNMDRYGTMDRRDKQGPMPYFNTKGTGSAQGGQRQPLTRPRGGVPQIPAGSDVPGGQGPNPLMRPTPATAAQKMQQTQQQQTQQQGQENWLDMLAGDDEKPEDDFSGRKR